MKYDVIFLGGGQAGIFGAYEAIKKNEDLKILVIDKGRMLTQRVCPKEKLGWCVKCPTCAIIFGVSGAGAFSDSKFNMDYRVGGDVHVVTGKAIVNDTIKYVADIYKEFGFDEKPTGLEYNQFMLDIKKRCIETNVQLVDTPTMHLGTDGSRELYTKLVNYLLEKGVEFATEREAEELIIENGAIEGVVVSHKGKEEIYYSSNVVIGMGRSGAKKLMDICQKHGVNYETGAVDVGVRVEIPDIVMKDINENFYEAKMIYYTQKYKDRMRTFCSNPSGFIAAEKHGDDVVLANGHAYKDKKSTNTNLALLCTKTFTEPFNQPFEYATAIAKMSAMLTGGKILMQSYGDLKAGRRSTEERLARLNIVPTTEDYVAGDISLACPKRILDNIIEFIEVHDKITPGFASSDLLLYFPEIKFRSTRIEIDKNMETNIKGLYATGDSSGYGSGLNIAAVMGILAVRHIVEK
ncbi:FAD-binding protein [Cetobacterium sp. 2A]|uniref:NAD(P)/FAD-dependent oxidoreductase n=1 Tax=Cetobacterium sp. 2A TaxID=2754723 RepID=UPI00163C63DA|nr:FAD-binding protein [Cetobacterium sp. 2A]MBC2855827.1 FAD-binding protein [Cetobacterium sp. 2A]